MTEQTTKHASVENDAVRGVRARAAERSAVGAACYPSMTMDARARAEWRRTHWTGGVAKGRDEIDAKDLAFWLSQPAEERIASVFDMWDEQLRLQDPDHEASSRLQRSVGGVRARRR